MSWMLVRWQICVTDWYSIFKMKSFIFPQKVWFFDDVTLYFQFTLSLAWLLMTYSGFMVFKYLHYISQMFSIALLCRGTFANQCLVLFVKDLCRKRSCCAALSEGTYLLMSSWFIRKETFNEPLSWRDLCKSPSNQACGGEGWGWWVCRGEGEGLLHKDGAQSAGIALHSKGASAGLYWGSLFWGPCTF